MLFDYPESYDLRDDVQYTSPFEMINKCGEFLDTRRRLEIWFQEYPSSARKDLRSRFRTADSSNHRGALFELVLHALFVRLGCELEIHPGIDGSTTKPDFGVRHGEERFFLEATSVGKQMGPFTRNRNEEKVIENLEELTSPCFDIAVEMEGELVRTLGKNAVHKSFAQLLASHQPEGVRRQIEEGGTFAAPSETIRCGDWCLRGYLAPIDEAPWHTGASRKIRTHHAIAKFTDAMSPVRDALRVKSKKYGSLDEPLIVAVNASDMFYNGEENDMELLFGDEHITYYKTDSGWSSPKLTHNINGLWSQETKHIDGIIRFQRIDVFNLASANACLYLNPWKSNIVLPRALLRLPHARFCPGKINRVQGEEVSQLLGVKRTS